jgi:hypothetical protein
MAWVRLCCPRHSTGWRRRAGLPPATVALGWNGGVGERGHKVAEPFVTVGLGLLVACLAIAAAAGQA